MVSKDRGITERQKEYIESLSSYPSTENEDEKDIREYLNDIGKKSISELSLSEASELIQLLLKRPVEYEYPCGKREFLHKREVNCFNCLGDMEACLHCCPDEHVNGDVNGCPYWKGYNAGLNEGYAEAEFKYAAKLIENNFWDDKCFCCNKFVIRNKNLFEELKELYPDKVVFGTPLEHHTDYEKDIRTTVCSSCHQKIHQDTTHPLYPKNKRRK